MIKLNPIKNKILVKPVKIEERKGGIFIPESAQKNADRAEVVQVGDDPNITVKVGDTVILMKMAGMQIEIDNEKYIILTENEILAILDD